MANRISGPTFAGWKLAPPQIPEYAFARPHLVTAIESALTGPFGGIDTILVNAPPGYGKSTLLAQWAATTNFPTLWYHLDASDNDPATLLYGLIYALRTLAPRGHWAARELLANMQHGTLEPRDVRRAAEVFARDISAHLSKPAVLILTGADKLEPRGQARELIEHLLARTRDYLRLVLEYRDLELLNFSTPLLQGRIKGFGLEDLQCTHEELATLLASRGLSAEASEVDRLHEICDGWIAGAVLATGACLPEVFARRITEDFNRAAVFDYVAREVLSQLPVPLYDFAVDISIFDDMTVPLCRDLLDVDDARQRLADLTRATGMVTRFGARPEEAVYRLQPLLRNVLRERLKERRSPEGLASLRVCAADLLERTGDDHSDEQAAQLYALAGAWDSLLALIERRRTRLLRAGRGATLSHWIDLLAPAQRAQHPDIAILRAELHRTAGRTALAEAAIEEVCAHLAASNGTSVLTYARALLARADVRYIRGRYAEARSDCERALELLPAEADELHMQAHLLLVPCTNMLEGPVPAKQLLDTAELRCRAMADHSTLARFYYLRGLLAHAMGAYLEAETAFGTALLHAQEAGDKVRIVASHLYRGSIRQHLGHAREARDDLTTALTQSVEIGHTQLQTYICVALADLELLEGNFASASEQAAVAQALVGPLGDQHLRALIAVSASRIAALDNDTTSAMAALSPALEEVDGAAEGQDWLLLQTAHAFALHRAGEHERAASLLEQVVSRAREQRTLADCAQAYVILAATRSALGEASSAEQALNDALDLAEQIDGTAIALLDARRLPLLRPLIAASTHRLASDLLARLTSQDDASEEIERGTLPIRVFMLGELDVRLGEMPVTQWQRSHVRDLLVYLLGNDRPVRKDKILEAFWPKKSAKAADTEFRKVRAALKSVLGRPCLVERNECWSLDVKCWVDADEFMHLTNQGVAALATDPTEAVHTLRQALSLWGGSYLDNNYSDWAVERRETYQVRYVHTLSLLADLALTTGDYSEAETLSLRLLKENAFDEDSYRRLMICLAMRGEYTQALQQYQKCKTLFHRGIHAEPSDETTQLRDKIRAVAKQGADLTLAYLLG